MSKINRIAIALLAGLWVCPVIATAASQEIIKNGSFKEIVPFAKKMKKWDIVGNKLPKFWFPAYTYGNAEAEVIPAKTAAENNELRIKRCAIAQYVKVKSNETEQVLEVSFDVRTSEGGSCLLRVNYSQNVATVNIKKGDKDKGKKRRYQAKYIVKPGKAIRRISFWSYTTSNVYLSNISAKVTGDMQPNVGDMQPHVREVAVPGNAATATTWVKVGAGGIKMTLSFRQGDDRKITIYPFSQIISYKRTEGKLTKLTKLLPNVGLDISGLQGNIRKFIRPNLDIYDKKEKDDYIAKWNSLPLITEHRFPITFVRNKKSLECYVDGQYAGRIPAHGGLKKITFNCPGGSEAGDLATSSVPQGNFLELDISRLKACEETAAKIKFDRSKVPHQVPFCVKKGRSINIDRTKLADKLKKNYLKRNAFYADDASALFTVPSCQYIRAWALCTMEDSAKKDTALTARLTRFVSGRWGGRARECLADTTVELPRANEKPGEGITRVGTVSLNGRKTPLWLVEIPLKSGDIQDIILYESGKNQQRSTSTVYGDLVSFKNGRNQRGTLNFGPYLDFELTSRLVPLAAPFGDKRTRPDLSKNNGVRVFAVSLEKSPVELELKQSQPGNIFHNAEKPEATILLRPGVSGKYQLRWRILDVDGRQVGTGKKALTLKTEQGETAIPIDLKQPQTGWYEIKFQLLKNKRLLLTHNASFALLGKDTRQAGYESPFATWWFCEQHFGTPDEKIAGPLILKAGFRRAKIAVARRYSEKKLAPWKFTNASLGWMHAQLGKAADKALIADISKKLQAYPHINNAMIFHEDAKANPYAQAPELIGLKREKEYPGADKRFKLAMRYAKLLRENFPQIKIFIGNSLTSTELVAEMLRRGFPEKYADYVGNESVTRAWLPEKLGNNNVQSNWLLREIPRKFGYKKWGVTNCYESNYRQIRLLGEERQAQWYVRDALLAMAYRAPYISIGLIYDQGNRYQASFWGDVALCQRYPLLYPHKSYVAVATLTRLLDRAKFTKSIPTGSNSVYAMEFSRPDNKWVYAVWTSRGTCELNIKLAGAAPVEICDMYGRSRFLKTRRDLSIKATTAAQYLVSPRRIAAISRGRRTYPDDQPPKNLLVVDKMDNIKQWELKTGETPLLESKELPFRTYGKFALRQVNDPEKGQCLEVELLPGKKALPVLMNEYAVLKLKKPIKLPGEPTTLGIWVKGNSGWGQVFWEIEDANGKKRISCGTTAHGGTDVFDYPGSVSINFDGWNFLRMPITKKSPVRELSTGSVQNLWNKERGSKALAFPIKLTGIAVSMSRQALHLTEMSKIKQVIRLKDVSVYK